MNRKVKRVLFAEKVDMGGFPVRQPFPTQQVDYIDPFLLLHHAEVKFSANRDPKTMGVGPHPHRGFSPVTFVFKGGVHHRDSRGNDSIIYEGGTQWMNAGMGIIHSERPPDNIQEVGGKQEIIQLWVNTSSSHKMDEPAYFGLSHKDTPFIRKSDKEEIQLVAGNYENMLGPITTQTEVVAIRATFTKGGHFDFTLPKYHNAYLYALDGQVRLKGHGVMDGLHLAQFEPGEGEIAVEALEDTRFILMSGAPLNEEVASHGPFVMNNQTEILEAMRDYQMGKMGFLVEE